MDSFQNRPHSPPAREVKFSLRGRGHGTLPEPREKVGESPDHPVGGISASRERLIRDICIIHDVV